MTVNTTPLEDDECYTFVEYLEILVMQGKVVKFTHIPNETFTKSWKVKVRNKKLGVRRGLCDYQIVLKNDMVYIEMKRQKGGVVSKDQKEWIEALNATGKVDAYVCKGAGEAMRTLNKYL